MNGTAAAAAIAKAIRASGVIVRVEPAEFQKLLSHNPEALVVHVPGRWYSPGHKYLMGYKGLAFFASSREGIPLPGRCQVVEAKRIWVPG